MAGAFHMVISQVSRLCKACRSLLSLQDDRCIASSIYSIVIMLQRSRLFRKVDFMQGCQLLTKIGFGNASHSLPIMSPKQIGYVFNRNWHSFTVALFEKYEIVVQTTIAFHVPIDGAVQIRKVYLGYLELPLWLEFVLKTDYVVKELSELVPCLFRKTKVGLYGVADLELTHLTVHERLEFSLSRLDKLKKVCVSHLIDSFHGVDWELASYC